MTSEETATPTDGATDGAPGVRTTFRAVPLPALVAVGFLAIGVSPVAFTGGVAFLLYLLPLALAWWVVRTRTVVDGTSLRVASAVGSRRIGWDEVATLRVAERGWVRVVREDGSGTAVETALTGVRPRDLGRLAQASGGRITMPTPEEVEEAREHERELEATRLRIARLRELEAERDAETKTEADTPPGEGGERA
ncbi:hypothetical protein GCM10023200_21800 [Actinomycetospora chlora]|uniref:Low molecular weight protein antigen 6 PH domain-containing protein n=1 Tax=Actinomycetospora chlora TaxID=663608 RepID=A0ABP9AX84_9PSEU